MSFKSIPDLKYAVSIITGTTVLFKMLNMLMSTHGPITSHALATGKQIRWCNITVSLLNASILSISSLYCFSLYPHLAEYSFRDHERSAIIVSCLSIGYFIYDSFEALQKEKKDWMVLIHHVVVVFCFGTVVLKHQYVCFVIASLLSEINSVFLHIRQLMNMSGVSRESSIYKSISFTNMLTFIIFRFGTALWIIKWILWEKETICQFFFTVGLMGTVLWLMGNVQLFSQIYSSDFLRPKHKLQSKSPCLNNHVNSEKLKAG